MDPWRPLERSREAIFLSKRCKGVNSDEIVMNLNETAVGVERGDAVKRDSLFVDAFHRGAFSLNYSGGRAG